MDENSPEHWHNISLQVSPDGLAYHITGGDRHPGDGDTDFFAGVHVRAWHKSHQKLHGGFMRAYIAGPMSGIPDFNRQVFNDAARILRKEEYEVINPAELDDHEGRQGMTWEDFMRRDIPYVLGCQRVFVLPGWENSRGAKLEIIVAQSVGISRFFFETRKPFPPLAYSIEGKL